MRTLEASRALCAAKITNENGAGMVVTLFPMVHAAEPSFYAKVFHSAFEEHDIALTKTVRAAEDGTLVSVVYGAAHIPAVLRVLPGLGFVWKESDWNVVFRI